MLIKSEIFINESDLRMVKHIFETLIKPLPALDSKEIALLNVNFQKIPASFEFLFKASWDFH